MRRLRLRGLAIVPIMVVGACERRGKPAVDTVVDSALDSAALAATQRAIDAGAVSETIPAHPFTWEAGSVDSFMSRNAPLLVRRSPAPSFGLRRLETGTSAEYW